MPFFLGRAFLGAADINFDGFQLGRDSLELLLEIDKDFASARGGFGAGTSVSQVVARPVY